MASTNSLIPTAPSGMKKKEREKYFYNRQSFDIMDCCPPRRPKLSESNIRDFIDKSHHLMFENYLTDNARKKLLIEDVGGKISAPSPSWDAGEKDDLCSITDSIKNTYTCGTPSSITTHGKNHNCMGTAGRAPHHTWQWPWKSDQGYPGSTGQSYNSKIKFGQGKCRALKQNPCGLNATLAGGSATGTMDGMWQNPVKVTGFLHNNDWIFVHKDGSHTKVVVVKNSELIQQQTTPKGEGFFITNTQITDSQIKDVWDKLKNVSLNQPAKASKASPPLAGSEIKWSTSGFIRLSPDNKSPQQYIVKKVNHTNISSFGILHPKNINDKQKTPQRVDFLSNINWRLVKVPEPYSGGCSNPPGAWAQENLHSYGVYYTTSRGKRLYKSRFWTGKRPQNNCKAPWWGTVHDYNRDKSPLTTEQYGDAIQLGTGGCRGFPGKEAIIDFWKRYKPAETTEQKVAAISGMSTLDDYQKGLKLIQAWSNDVRMRDWLDLYAGWNGAFKKDKEQYQYNYVPANAASQDIFGNYVAVAQRRTGPHLLGEDNSTIISRHKAAARGTLQGPIIHAGWDRAPHPSNNVRYGFPYSDADNKGCLAAPNPNKCGMFSGNKCRCLDNGSGDHVYCSSHGWCNVNKGTHGPPSGQFGGTEQFDKNPKFHYPKSSGWVWKDIALFTDGRKLTNNISDVNTLKKDGKTTANLTSVCKCDEGFHYDATVTRNPCVPNKCKTCVKGTSAQKCYQHNTWDCVSCNAGYKLESLAAGGAWCTPCRQGKTATNGTNVAHTKTNCTRHVCTNGTAIPATQAKFNNQCSKCYKGYKLVNDLCTPCPTGEWSKPDNAAPSCSPSKCLNGDNKNNNKKRNGPKECEKCLPGYKLQNAICTPCPAGFWTTEHTVKSSGDFTKTTNTNARHTDTECIQTKTPPSTCTINGKSVGTNQPPSAPQRVFGGCSNCNSGYEYDGTTKKCTACPAGKFKSGTDQLSCQLCPAGTYSDKQAQTTCSPCPAGKYQPSPGKSGCIPCPSGEFQSSEGGSRCLYCSPGKESNSKNTACSPCRPGWFKGTDPIYNKGKCAECPPGRESKTDRTGCTPCPSGQKKKRGETICTYCPAGKQPNVGKTDCSPCPKGYAKATPGFNNGSCKSCPRGTYQDSDKWGVKCKSCKPHTYNNTPGRTTSCSNCPIGTDCERTGCFQCKDCRSGTHNPSAGGKACAPCSPGKYQPSPGKDKCKPCIKGTYSNRAGSSQCILPSPDYKASGCKELDSTICTSQERILCNCENGPTPLPTINRICESSPGVKLFYNMMTNGKIIINRQFTEDVKNLTTELKNELDKRQSATPKKHCDKCHNPGTHHRVDIDSNNPNYKKCQANICKCHPLGVTKPIGCAKLSEVKSFIGGETNCKSTQNHRWIDGKCYKCDVNFTADTTNTCTKDNKFYRCEHCNEGSGHFLNGNECIPHKKCIRPLVAVSSPTNKFDRVCGISGKCPPGTFTKKSATRYTLSVCEKIGMCENGTLIDKSIQTQKNQCASCNPGYRKCIGVKECEQATVKHKYSKESYIVPPSPIKDWQHEYDCVPNKCKCSNGKSITPDTLPNPANEKFPKVFFKPSDKCLLHNSEVCKSCDDGYYLVKDPSNSTAKCVEWKTCKKNQWLKNIGTGVSDRVCVNCPINTTLRKEEIGKSNKNIPGSIKDCKCTSGSEIEIKDNQNNIIDIKCTCLNGKLVNVRGNEKDCVCDAGYYGGGKKKKVDLKDITNYQPYTPCMKMTKCICNNGNPATNIPCDSRNIKKIVSDRITNTSTFGECPIINTSGRRWSSAMGPLSDPKNAGFKQSSRKCPTEGQLLCESCMNGFVFNKRKIIKKDGTYIPINTTCVLATDDNAKPQSTQQPTPIVVTTDTMKQTVSGKKIKRVPYKTTRLNDGSATSNVYNMMIQSNRR